VVTIAFAFTSPNQHTAITFASSLFHEVLHVVPLQDLAMNLFLLVKPFSCLGAALVFLDGFIQSGCYSIGFLLASYVCFILAGWSFGSAMNLSHMASTFEFIWSNILDFGISNLFRVDRWAAFRKAFVRTVWNNPMVPFVFSFATLVLLSNESFMEAVWAIEFHKREGSSPLHSHAFAWMVWIGAIGMRRNQTAFNKTFVVPFALLSLFNGTKLGVGLALAYFVISIIVSRYEMSERERAAAEFQEMLRAQVHSAATTTATTHQDPFMLNGRQAFVSEECQICMEPLSQASVALLSCGHVLHKPCLETWFQINRRCPICRHPQDRALAGLVEIF
jgi:hypothetical protein